MNGFDKFKSKDWRINNLYKIIDKKARLIRFRERNFQTEIRKHQSLIKMVLKYRQGGVTTGCVLDLLDDTLFTPNITTMILAHKRQDLPKIFDKVRLAYKEMDPRLKPPIDKGGGSRYEMRFPSLNSKIYTDIENRGDTIHRLHVSEAAYVDPEKRRATLGAVVPGAPITYESTANGMGGDYYENWINPNNNRAKLFFPWFIQPEYQISNHNVQKLTAEEKELVAKALKHYGVEMTLNQIAWRRAMLEEYKEDFLQEYPEDDLSCFLTSGTCPMDQQFLSMIMQELTEPIINDSGLKVWKNVC